MLYFFNQFHNLSIFLIFINVLLFFFCIQYKVLFKLAILGTHTFHLARIYTKLYFFIISSKKNSIYSLLNFWTHQSLVWLGLIHTSNLFEPTKSLVRVQFKPRIFFEPNKKSGLGSVRFLNQTRTQTKVWFGSVHRNTKKKWYNKFFEFSFFPNDLFWLDNIG